MATFNTTRALTLKIYVLIQGISLPKSSEKCEVLCTLPFSFLIIASEMLDSVCCFTSKRTIGVYFQ